MSAVLPLSSIRHPGREDFIHLPDLDTFSADDVTVSFEFFPPATDAMHTQLWAAVERLKPVGAKFVSVTYGAGGTTRERTHDVVKRLQGECGLATAAHLTCVGATRDEIDEVAESYWAAGIRHIVALRGDPPEGLAAPYRPWPGGYAHADDLVAGLKRLHPFEVSVAAYPEVHPQAASPDADLDALKRKIDHGATRALTQFCFDLDAFERFLERVARAGITIPVVPGILPIQHFGRAVSFAARCGAIIPAAMHRQFAGLDQDPETRQQVAAIVATEQVRALFGLGMRQFHFYTLNRAELVYTICHMLGLRAAVAAA